MVGSKWSKFGAKNQMRGGLRRVLCANRLILLVPGEAVEPTRYLYHRILSLKTPVFGTLGGSRGYDANILIPRTILPQSLRLLADTRGHEKASAATKLSQDCRTAGGDHPFSHLLTVPTPTPTALAISRCERPWAASRLASRILRVSLTGLPPAFPLAWRALSWRTF